MNHQLKKKASTLALGLAGLAFLNTGEAASYLFVVHVPGLKPPVVLTTNPAAFNFGSVPIGQSVAEAFTVMNTGGSTAAGVQYSVTPGYSLSGNCGVSLAPGASCQEQVTFAPGAGQSYPGTLAVTSGTVVSATQLSGLGLSTTDSLSVGSLSFAAQQIGTSSAAQGVTLSNTGNTTLSIGQIGASGNFSAAQNCGPSLAGGASCNINVTFTPQTLNSNTGTLSIQTTLGTQTVPLSGTGQQAIVAAAPASLTFGSIVDGQSSSIQSFTLTNGGNIAATTLSILPPSGFSQTNNCGTSLAAGATCVVSVTFSPTTSGPAGANVVVASSAATADVSVSGTGATACSASPTVVTQNSDFSMAVPAGCGHATVDMWGAGGAGLSGAGGGAGYAGTTISFASTDTILVKAGQGGALSDGTSYAAGGGGGGSFIYVNGALKLAAGGGGGGGGTGSQKGGTAGGAGGGSAGVAGGSQVLYQSNVGNGGGGATQSAGGAGGAGITDVSTQGNSGSSLTGGTGWGATGHYYGGGGVAVTGSSGNGGEGGGGGGYYGGGAGSSGGYYVGGSGGGGGSGYVAAGLTGTLTAGSGVTPGYSGSPLRSGAGAGNTNGSGVGGRVVLTWSQ